MDFFRFWTLSPRLRPDPDSFIVLSYALKNKTVPTAPTRVIIELAVSWWRQHPKAVIVMSTGDNQNLGVTNTRVMKAYARSLGVPEKNLIEEGNSLDTLSNLTESRKIIKDNKFKRPLFVLYDLHTRRAAATARTLGISDFYFISTGGPGEPAYGWKFFQTYSRLTIFLYEALAYVYYVLRGKIRY